VDSDIVCIKLQGEGVPFSGWTLYKVTIPRFSFFYVCFCHSIFQFTDTCLVLLCYILSLQYHPKLLAAKNVSKMTVFLY